MRAISVQRKVFGVSFFVRQIWQIVHFGNHLYICKIPVPSPVVVPHAYNRVQANERIGTLQSWAASCSRFFNPQPGLRRICRSLSPKKREASDLEMLLRRRRPWLVAAGWFRSGSFREAYGWCRGGRGRRVSIQNVLGGNTLTLNVALLMHEFAMKNEQIVSFGY
jgi:hypothetical protein